MLRKSGQKSSKKVSFHEMSDEELRSMARQFKKELQQLRFQLVTGTVPNTARITHLKRDVARIYTVLRQRELGISAKSKSGK